MGVTKANASGPTDPLLAQQWYLQASGAGLNVAPVWQRYDGTGVTVAIWDDGVEYTHPDLAPAYDPSLAPTFDGVVHDPAPEDAASQHGTAVAGIIAAARNGVGTVGIAYGAHFSAVDIFEDFGRRLEHRPDLSRPLRLRCHKPQLHLHPLSRQPS